MNKSYKLNVDCWFYPWAYGKEKIRGAEINLPDFSDCARPLPKKFFSEQINFGDLPPPPLSPKKFRSVYHFRGPKIFSGTIHCQYCPTSKRIFQDYFYLNNKLRYFGLFRFLFPYFLPDLFWIFARLFDFAICLGGQLPPLPPRPVRLWFYHTALGFAFIFQVSTPLLLNHARFVRNVLKDS